MTGERITPAAYVGNSDYCYAYSLHMVLLATGTVPPEDIPLPGFIECLTTQPFGKTHLDLKDGPISYFSSAAANPNEGLTIAIKTMGWTCQYHAGGDADSAFAALHAALDLGPVLVGPVDMGYLTFNPYQEYLAGADHYVMVISVDDKDKTVTMHDPKMYPYATLPIADFMQAWKAERLSYYAVEPYVFRSDFKRLEQPNYGTMIARTVDIVRKQLAEKYNGPVRYGGAEAIRRMAANLDKPTVRDGFAVFTLPFAARCAIDASSFLHNAGHTGARGALAASLVLSLQARLYGKALYFATQKHWSEVEKILLELARLEEDFERQMLM